MFLSVALDLAVIVLIAIYRKSRETVYRGFNGGTNYSLELMQAQNTNR